MKIIIKIKLLFLLLLFAVGSGAIAQITQAEYFIDSDPGAGSGIAMSAQDGSLNSAMETILKNGISTATIGIHAIGIRVKTSAGWSPVFKTVVSIESATAIPNVTINSAELFWDTDPGQGNGIPLLAYDGNFDSALETVFNDGITLPSNGIHKLGIRVKNRNNHWGTVFTQVISIENLIVPTIHVTSSECFWDTDPGQGSGTTLLAFDGNYDQALETVFQNGISLPAAGMHKLNIRVKNRNNNWGPIFSSVISVENNVLPRALKIKSGEAYWDLDPGVGWGIPLLAFDGNFNDAIETVSRGLFTGTLSLGKHKLCIRVKDATNTWSPVFTSVVFVDGCANSPTPTLTAAGSTTFCGGDSLKLTAGAGYNSYKWVRGSALLPDTTQSIWVKTSGYYKAVVTDAGSCPGASTAIAVTVIPANPIIAVYGDTVFCQGGSVILDAGNAFETYAWSTGATSSSISVIASGAYVVTITNSGCTKTSRTQIITVHPNPSIPVITPSGATAFCLGGSVTLTSSVANAYSWNTGDTSQAITVQTGGNYSVTASNVFGCTNQSVPQNVTVTSSTPDIIVNGSLNICNGDAVTLDAGTGYTSYLWSNGATTQMISASTAETFTVTVTSVACIGNSNPVTVSLYAAPPAPIIAVTGSTTFCSGDSVILTSNAPTGNVWSNGKTTQSITVFSSGNFTVTASNSFGCSATSAGVALSLIPVNTSLTIVGASAICSGDTVLINAQTGYDHYAWSTGDTTSFIKVGSTGTYFVTITNQSCSSISESKSILASQRPGVPNISQIGSNQFCNGGSVQLVSDVADSYLWSNGATTQSIMLYNSGSYFVNVYNTFGCSNNSLPVTVSAYPNPVPNIIYTGTTSLCSGDSIVLSSSVSNNILWSTGATTQSIVVRNSGNYTVTADNGNGCSATSSPVAIVVSQINPLITTSGATTFCQGGSVTLNVGAGYDSYYWSTGETTSSIAVNQNGNYSVDVTFGGCSRTAAAITVNVLSLPAIPTITAAGPTTFCSGGSVALTSSVGSSYLWSDGQSGQSATVTTSGCYSVTVSDINGCSRAASCVTVTANPTPVTPVITPNGALSFCYGGSVQLTASPATSYLWSTGEITSYLVANNSGTYSVTVTNANGCTAASASTVVTAYPNVNVPTIQITGSTTFCEGDSVILTSSEAANNFWSNGQTTQSITVTAGGTYHVAIQNTYGCNTVSTDQTIVVNQAPSLPIITPNGPTTFCSGPTLTLTTGTANSYLWSNGDTTQAINVSNSGIFIVTVSSANGCSATSSTMNVTVNPSVNVPTINITGTTTFCEGDSVILTSSAATDNYWSNGKTTQSITVTASDTFYVAVQNIYGCNAVSGDLLVTVYPAQSVPIVTPGGPTTFCSGSTLTLTSTPANSYLWSNGATTQAISVSNSGNFSVTVANATGCSATSTNTSVTVYPSVNVPTVQASGNTTFCQGGSVTLTSSETSGNLWSNGATTQSIAVTTSGAFHVTIQNTWCSAVSIDKVITVNPKPAVPSISHVLPVEFCEGDSVELVSDLATSYHWSNNATTRQITVKHTGIFDVIVTNQYGCSNNSLSTQVEEFIVPKPIITRYGQTLTSTPAYDYQWYFNGVPKTNETSISINIITDGHYMVEAIDSNGCSKNSDIYLTTGIGDIAAAGSQIVVYPNPFSDHTTFSITNQDNISDVSFTLHDVLGKIVRVESALTDNKYVLNRESLSKGIYFYQFTARNNVIGYGKLIIE